MFVGCWRYGLFDMCGWDENAGGPLSLEEKYGSTLLLSGFGTGERNPIFELRGCNAGRRRISNLIKVRM